MKLTPFTVDARPHYGYQTIYVNPEEVSSIHNGDNTDNPTTIVLRNGTRYAVMGPVAEAVDKLQGAP